uniref:Uncharacterized protein n=1 Tax=Arundo donax TaxID=35708 RepID=A0A0A8YS06_ARUDO
MLCHRIISGLVLSVKMATEILDYLSHKKIAILMLVKLFRFNGRCKEATFYSWNNM